MGGAGARWDEEGGGALPGRPRRRRIPADAQVERAGPRGSDAQGERAGPRGSGGGSASPLRAGLGSRVQVACQSRQLLCGKRRRVMLLKPAVLVRDANRCPGSTRAKFMLVLVLHDGRPGHTHARFAHLAHLAGRRGRRCRGHGHDLMGATGKFMGKLQCCLVASGTPPILRGAPDDDAFKRTARISACHSLASRDCQYLEPVLVDLFVIWLLCKVQELVCIVSDSLNLP